MATPEQVTDREAFGRHRALIAFCVVASMAEALVVILVSRPARALAPQAVAIPPLGVFHDLRWLFVYADSWWVFGLGLAAIIVGRAALTTLLVRLAWPVELPKPGLQNGLWSSAAFTAFAAVLLSPMVALVFAVAVVPFSWPYLAAVPAVVLVGLLLTHGGVVGGWWRRLPPWPALAWLLASVVVLSTSAVIVTSMSAVVAVPVAALAGLFDAWAWYSLTASVAHRQRQSTRPFPITPVSAVALLLSFVLLARLGFAVAARPPLVGPAPAAVSGLRPVLVVGGFGSPCCLQAVGLQAVSPDLLVRQFSYRGLDGNQQPLPHGSAATDVTLPVLGDRLAAQVDQLYRATGQPVSIVAESEGTLGVYAYLDRHADRPVAALVLLSPIVQPGRATYPIAGKEGKGVVAGWEMRGTANVVAGLSPFGSSEIVTVIQSTNAVGAGYAAASSCPSTIPRLTIIPLADALTLPTGPVARSALVVPDFHGGLLGHRDIDRTVHAFLDGKRVGASGFWRGWAEVVSGAAAAWGVPSHPPPAAVCAARPLP
jgi:hypothetical protein